MERLSVFISDNPLVAVALGFLAILILYFLLKQFVKLALILIIILLALGGYYYFKDPRKAPENIRSAVKEVKEKTIDTKDKLQDMYHSGRDLLKKAKELVQEPQEASDARKLPEGEKKGR